MKLLRSDGRNRDGESELKTKEEEEGGEVLTTLASASCYTTLFTARVLAAQLTRFCGVPLVPDTVRDWRCSLESSNADHSAA